MTQLNIGLNAVESEPQDEPARPALAPAPAPDPMPSTSPVLGVTGTPMTFRDQTTSVLAFAYRNALARWRHLASREGGVVNAVIESKPASIREECDYAQSRAWVPRGHEGGLFEVLGVFHHALIGRPGVALGNAITAICHKPLRFWLLFLTLALIVLIVYLAS